jgi:hypothetical protein
MTQRIEDRLHGDEYIASGERFRRSHQAGEWLDDFMSEGALVEVDGKLCVRALSLEERKSRALEALNRVPKCLEGKIK